VAKDIPNFNHLKRIKIYQYFVQSSKLGGLSKKEDVSKSGKPDSPKSATKKIGEDLNLIRELRKKINFSSQQTILEFSNRRKQGKDPHYKK